MISNAFVVKNKPMKTPSQALSEKIIERLIREELITAETAKAIQPKLAEGKLRGEDWRLPIELGVRRDMEAKL